MSEKISVSPSSDDLALYPRPNVAVDVAMFTVAKWGANSTLHLMLHRRHGEDGFELALPGRFVRERQTLEDAARDALGIKLGVKYATFEQLHVFDNPYRDPRGWVMSVAHMGMLPWESAEQATAFSPDVVLRPIIEDEVALGYEANPLPYEQNEIVTYALAELRKIYSALPDPLRCLSDEFTLAELREVHEAVLGSAIQPDTFRREMKPNLIATGEYTKGLVGKPAEIFIRKKKSDSFLKSPSRSTRVKKSVSADELFWKTESDFKL